MITRKYSFGGQVATKQIHSEWAAGTYPSLIQNTDFHYNIRGWLTAINDPENTAAKNDIFAMKLHYSDAMTGLSAPLQYNGNISSVNWATNHDGVKSAYAYNYDDLDRLTSGAYYQGNANGYSHDGSFDEKDLAYDANGNLTTLHRYGAGTKLAKIVKDGDALPADSLIYCSNFVYDLNGSLQ